jgi:signal transduction histidine kinase
VLLPQERSEPGGAGYPAGVPPKADAAPSGTALAGGRGLRALITRWGPDVFLVRSLLASAWLAASVYCALLAVRARVSGDSPWPVLGAGALLLVALTLPHVPRAPARSIACALLGGAALAALTVLSRPYDPLVFGLYSLALVLAALVLNGRDTAAITAHYFVYYVLYNVLIADPTSASLHWESAAATLLVFAGIALAVWSLVAGQRWLRASRQVVEAANVQLEASLAREQRFVGDAAHQLRTPLAILRASAAAPLPRSRSPTR